MAREFAIYQLRPTPSYIFYSPPFEVLRGDVGGNEVSAAPFHTSPDHDPPFVATASLFCTIGINGSRSEALCGLSAEPNPDYGDIRAVLC